MAFTRLTWQIKRILRTALVAVGKSAPFLLDLMRFTSSFGRTISYALVCLHNPVEPQTFVFECYSGRGYSCSPRGLYRALLAEGGHSREELVWAFKGPIVSALAQRGGYTIRGLDGFYPGAPSGVDLDRVFGVEALEELRHAVIVPFGSREYYRVHARASKWISNSIIPTHLRPRAGQVYLQTWHGTPLKRLGCDIALGTSNAMFSAKSIHARYRNEGARFTHLVSPSEFASSRFITAFDLERLGKVSSIIEEGYPRNDMLSTFTPEQAAAVKRRLGIPEGKKVVLYAPTWRDDQHVAGVGYTYDLGVDFGYLQEALADECVVLFRAHYLIANEFDFSRYEGFLYDVSDINDINDLYIVSDLLVTDYSSVFFDFSILGRPILFYMYDLEAYAEEVRGFYLDLEELPGPIVRTQEDLVGTISDAASRLTGFRERFAYLDDGHASERVLACIRPQEERSSTSQ